MHEPLLYAVYCIWKQWECNRSESRQFDGILWVMFLGEMTKEMSLEETDDRNKLDKKLWCSFRGN